MSQQQAKPNRRASDALGAQAQVSLATVVNKETRDALTALKGLLGAATMAEVLDRVLPEALERQLRAAVSNLPQDGARAELR